MNVILQKDVKNLGKAGDQVSVKKGFARNFLIPKAYAFPVDKARLKLWKHQQLIISAKKRKALSERKKLIEKLSHIKLKFEKVAQKDDRLFGSVTAYEISQALEDQHGLSVDKKDIHFTELKTVGEHSVKIRLDSEHQTEIKLSIKALKSPSSKKSEPEALSVEDSPQIEKPEAKKPVTKKESNLQVKEQQKAEPSLKPNVETQPKKSTSDKIQTPQKNTLTDNQENKLKLKEQKKKTDPEKDKASVKKSSNEKPIKDKEALPKEDTKTQSTKKSSLFKRIFGSKD